jgi:hypothetical protein
MTKKIIILAAAFILFLPFCYSFCGDYVCEEDETALNCQFDCTEFIRGDVNTDGELGIPDVVSLFNYYEGSPLKCYDAADVDDDGKISADYSLDAIYLLKYLYSGGAEPKKPFAMKGPDQTKDELNCDKYSYAGHLLIGKVVSSSPCRCTECFVSEQALFNAKKVVDRSSWFSDKVKEIIKSKFDRCIVREGEVQSPATSAEMNDDITGQAAGNEGPPTGNTFLLVTVALVSLVVYLIVIKISRK